MADKEKYVYKPDDSLFNRKIDVNPVPEPEVGIDQQQEFIQDIISSMSDTTKGNGLNMAKIEQLCHVSQNRNTIFDLVDTMMEDPIISAAIEMYCEDATETNDKGEIIWVESTDKDVTQYINYLLRDLNVDKNIYKWINCLVKYGDVYLRLYHESEYEQDDLFDDVSNKSTLNEDLILKAYRKSDNFAHYVSMVSNPAEMFELTKFGKTYAYIQAPVRAYMSKKKESNWAYGDYTYNFKKQDVNIYTADNFVHGSLDDLTSRENEEINLSLTSEEETQVKYTYTVKRGQSSLYNVYKIWRQNMLLYYALLLNRLSKSSNYKIVQVEMKDGPRSKAQAKLMAVKNMFEQKAAVGVDQGMNEYTNSGPAENTIYVATYNGEGAISVQDMGSDLNVTGLDDVNLFKKRLYAALKIPPQFFGDTEEAGGFDGGTSLSLTSSRYAKTIKRFQNVAVQMVTDLINILLIDKGFSSYIGKFQLRMQEPTTREEVDRKDALVNRITVVQDTMSLFDDIQDPVARLTILKNLLGGISTDSEILTQLDEQIEKLKLQEAQLTGEAQSGNDEVFDDSAYSDMSAGLPGSGEPGLDFGEPTTQSAASTDNGAGELPTPEALGQDFVNM